MHSPLLHPSKRRVVSVSRNGSRGAHKAVQFQATGCIIICTRTAPPLYARFSWRRISRNLPSFRWTGASEGGTITMIFSAVRVTRLVK